MDVVWDFRFALVNGDLFTDVASSIQKWIETILAVQTCTLTN